MKNHINSQYCSLRLFFFVIKYLFVPVSFYFVASFRLVSWFGVRQSSLGT
jgi:hypothetical protein